MMMRCDGRREERCFPFMLFLLSFSHTFIQGKAISLDGMREDVERKERRELLSVRLLTTN